MRKVDHGSNRQDLVGKLPTILCTVSSETKVKATIFGVSVRGCGVFFFKSNGTKLS